MRKIIEDLLVYLLGKMNKARLVGLTIGEKEVSTKMRAFIPDDGKWHHVNYTIVCGVKIEKGKTKKEASYYDDIKIFVDGKLNSHFKA